jgi:hypothetical protein
MKIVDTLSQHLQTPGESLQSHLRRKQLDLARDIRAAKKVYLDTKFWLLLRDARLGRNVGSDTVALLGLLYSGVAGGKLICPISADTYIEIFRQTDHVTLRACVELIDDLSKGVAIILLMERISLEVHHFLRRVTKGSDAVYPVEELIWTKIPYVLGFCTPTSKSFPPDVDLAVQKAFLDQLWVTKTADMLNIMGDDTRPLTEAFPDISDQLNRGKVDHHHENKSFKQLFLSELWGVLDLYKPYFEDIMAYIYEKDTGQRPSVAEKTNQVCGEKVANLIYNGFRFNKLTKELPSLWLGAGFHAAVRWDLKRKFKANDMPDFRHAVAAIPYCDFFLTEHSLRHLVGDKNLRLGTLFPCQTFSDASLAVEALAPICQQPGG